MKKAIPVIVALVLIVLIGVGYVGKIMWDKYSYSKEKADLDEYYGVLFAGFVLCIGTCLAISLPGKMKKGANVIVRPYSALRLVLNAGVSWIPAFLFVISHYISL